MGLAKLKTKISVEEYLAGEETSQIRYEFVDGEVYEMAGTSDRHNIISGNLFANLWSHLRDSSCQPFIENMKVRAARDVFYYPDVVVSCEENPESPYYRDEPVLIIEVISPSTAQIDRREKLRAYQQMPSVQEYVIVEQEKISVEIHRRQPDGRWITYFFNKNDEEFTLESVDLTLALTEVYRRVAFDL
jgi:Uma2 family endonuclease